jgi:TolB protein
MKKSSYLSRTFHNGKQHFINTMALARRLGAPASRRRVPQFETRQTRRRDAGAPRITPQSFIYVTFVGVVSIAFLAVSAFAQENTVDITKMTGPGRERPILVSVSGFTGEAAQVLQFDLYVQGFAFTNAEAAQYALTGSNNGNLQGRATDNITKSVKVAKAYSGASIRRQAHAFVDDFVQALSRKPIAQTKIAFKGQNGSNGEIFISDFDGFNAQQVTKDNSIVAAPSMVPGHLAMYYTSYKLNHPDIFYQNLSTGARRIFARYGGSNMSPAVSPDGSKVAMILSKDGWTDLYVCNADGSDLRRLTKSPQDESSPCWSPDGEWICYASKDRERRSLSKIHVSGGLPQRIPTTLVGNPTEPDWSPDGKWIAFTSQARDFAICVVPASGGDATVLAAGEDPSWAPNSRTLVFARRHSGQYVLSLLDAPTKQVKDVSRTSGSSSQSQPSWAR